MRETILVVDDEADVLDLVRYHLNRAGFDVDVASSGTAALLAARQRRPDAIVLDIMLPQMSGTEVFRKLRLEIDTAQIPVLMLTAKGLLSERIAGLELGVDDYIT
jgi:DNA-binding response OmpR family regulator